MSLKQEALAKARAIREAASSAKNELKPPKTDLKPLSDPTIPSPDKNAKYRMERMERTDTYITKALLPVMDTGVENDFLEPYEPPERDRHGRFKPGSVGNPRGPEVGIVGHIRLMTSNGREMVDLMLRAARGWLLYRSPVDGTAQWMPIEPKSRLDAIAWLADRGWGKAVQVIEMPKTQEQEQDFSTFTPEQLRLWLELDALSRKQLPPTIGSASRTLPEGESADVEAVTPPLPQDAPK